MRISDFQASDPHAIKVRVRDNRRFIEHRRASLNALWEGEPRIAREEIAKHVGKITLKPILRTYGLGIPRLYVAG